jgi:GT2 family glycosyltransferase
MTGGPAPDLTAIVVAHDVRDEVLRCLESLRRHAGGLDVEAILVDNASRDGTAEAVTAAHPGTQVLRLDHNANVVARNAGLAHARGRYRMFIDSDAAVTAGALPTLIDYLDEHPGVGLAGPRLVYRDGRLQLSCRRYPPVLLPVLRRPPLGRWLEQGRTVRHHLMADEPHERIRRVEYVLGACQVFRAAAQRAVGGTDRRIWFGHDDADWCFAIRRAGWDVAYVPDAVVVHDYRRLSAQQPLSRHALRQLQAHAWFQVKWAPHRRALIEEGRAMDREARDAGLMSQPPVDDRGTTMVGHR